MNGPWVDGTNCGCSRLVSISPKSMITSACPRRSAMNRCWVSLVRTFATAGLRVPSAATTGSVPAYCAATAWTYTPTVLLRIARSAACWLVK
jgi:hypothetical protein